MMRSKWIVIFTFCSVLTNPFSAIKHGMTFINPVASLSLWRIVWSRFYVNTRETPPRSSWTHPLGPPPPPRGYAPPGGPPPPDNRGYDGRRSPYPPQQGGWGGSPQPPQQNWGPPQQSWGPPPPQRYGQSPQPVYNEDRCKSLISRMAGWR